MNDNNVNPLDAALHAVSKIETWSQREQRLLEGRSSPTGWPIVRLDDGISIPPKPFMPKTYDDPLSPARGVINGVLLSIPIWALIVFVVYEVVK